VPTTSLAEIVDAHGEIDLLKLDCEGAEYGIVAATPAAAWARVGSVRIEYHAGQAEELTFTLVRHGFRVSRHAPDPAWPKAIGMLHLERTYRARSAAPARPLREARGANGTTSAGGRMGDDWKRIDEQVLVITGGSSGIGLATARLAVEAGARVVLAARDRRALRRATDRLRAHGEVVWVDADVGDPADVEEIGRAARRRFGGVDTWVNGAGVTMFGRLDELSLADQRRLFDTNFWGVVHGCRVAVPLLRARGRGVIVNVGSGLSDAAVPLQGIYSASKHAVQGFTDALRMELELADEPIAVTLVKPASIDTPIYDRARNYLPTEPEPIRPVYAPEVAARAILSAAERPVRDVFAGGGAKGLSALRHGAPRLADVVGEQLLAPQEAGHRPARPRADNLWRPADVPVAERAQERGSFEGRVHGRSAYTAATQRPGVTALVAAGIGLAVAAGVRGLVGGARPERPARGDAP
jgi:NAD(P)-dependent dehydrogenase (short-subunit alcohol dehydrogenase family)